MVNTTIHTELAALLIFKRGLNEYICFCGYVEWNKKDKMKKDFLLTGEYNFYNIK